MHFPAQNPAKTAIDFSKIHVAEKAAFWQTLDWGARPKKNGEPMMVSGGKIPHRSGVRMLFPPSLQRGEPRFARNKGGVRMLFPPRAFAFAKMRFTFLHHVRSGLAETAGLCINGAPAMRVALPNAYFPEIGPASGKFMLIFCSAGNPGFR